MSKNNKDFFKTKNSWSELKDKLLGHYLKPYFQKVLMTRKPIFYVDCFAGKGKFDDGQPGSPIIALQIREECLNKTNAYGGRIDTCFIELNHANDLFGNIKSFDGQNLGSLEVISGKYEDKIEKILHDKQKINVFLYIDPYGIRALDYGFFAKFANFGFSSIEMLINMNSFGFFRDACRVMKVDPIKDEAFGNLDDLVEYEPTQVSSSKESEDLLTNIAGGDYWKDIVRDYQVKSINGYEAESRFSTEYKMQLRKKYKYVLDMPFRIGQSQHPKYRMIHVSNHEDGCLLMANNMYSKANELFIQEQTQGQLPLFSLNVNNELEHEDEIKQKMLSLLDEVPDKMSATKLMAAFFTKYGVICDSKNIRKIWKNLEETKKIVVERNPPTTKAGKASTFFEEVKNQTVMIRLA